jgi:transposase
MSAASSVRTKTRWLYARLAGACGVVEGAGPLPSEIGAGQHGGAAGKTVADLLEALVQWRPSMQPNLAQHPGQLPALRRPEVAAGRGEAAEDLEILVLGHQLRVLRRQVGRPRLEAADRALLAAVSRALPRSRWSCFFVQAETLLRWHRRLVAGAWTYPPRGQGRPPLDHDVQRLIIRLAKENPRSGYQRIQGELQHLGMWMSATAIRTTLRRHGLDPAPRRATTAWRAFLTSRPPGSSPVTS